MVSTELIIPPHEPLRVYGGKHPLSNEHSRVEVPAGATIAEALDIVIASSGIDWPPDRFVASVNDVRVPREYWHRVKPKPGTVVVFRPLASGDENTRTLLFLGIAIAAMFIAPFIAGTVLGLTGTALTAASSIIGGAITIGGGFLLNALIPSRPPQADSGQPKTLPMVSGASNEVRPWGAIPVVLGRHRISPMFASMPYSHFTGQVQYMNMLFCLGYGALNITDLRIGDTVINDHNFKEVTTEIRIGYPGEPAPTLFKNAQPDEQPLGAPLNGINNVFVLRQSSATAATSLSYDVIAPQGVWKYNTKTGKYEDRKVTIKAQYRLHNFGQAAGPWIDRPDVVFSLNRDTVRKGDQWAVAAGQYDVQLRKETADAVPDDNASDAITWATLRAFTTGAPVQFPKPLALVAMEARGTDQFNGIISTFNCIVESYVNSWNGSSWVYGLSSNPADLYHWVLTGPANARPRDPTTQIDYASIQSWADDCRNRGYTYNAIISDQRTVREVLADIASAGRATVALRDGKWGVSFPRDNDQVSWHFTPRNSSGLKSTRTYREMPHALRVRYIDQDQNWLQTEGIVYNDNLTGGIHTLATAKLFESVEFPGITDWGNVHKAARFQLAQAILRPETHTLTADIESLRLERGDKVILSSDSLLIGTGYGRVTAVSGGTITIDSRVIMESGRSYRVTFTKKDGSMLTRAVYNTTNETDILFLDPGDGLGPSVPAVGNLFSFGEYGKVTNDYRVLDIRPGADLTAQVTLVDGTDFHDQYDNEPIPEYDPGITLQPDPFELAPKSLTYSERFTGSGIDAKATVQLTVQITRVGSIRAFEFQYLDMTTGGDWLPFAVVNAPLLSAEKSNLEAGTYNYRARALYQADGIGSMTNTSVSNWVYTNPVDVLSTLTLPPNVVGNLHITIQGDIMILDWDAVTAVNVAFYRLKYDPTYDGSATWPGSTLLMETNTNRAYTATRSGTYFVKAITYSGLESVLELEHIVVTSPPVPPNIVEVFNEGAAFIRSDGVAVPAHVPVFPGAHYSTQVDTGLLTLAFQPYGGNTLVKDTIVTKLGLASGLKLVLETGTTASWPTGNGQKWLDTSGLGYDFFRGLDATVTTNDPTFVGTPGDMTRSSYWSFNGSTYFTYDSVNEPWMNRIHQDSAKFTILVSVYVPALSTGLNRFLIGDTAATTQIGFEFYLTAADKISYITTNGSIGNFVRTSALTITAIGWHTVGVSIDEVAGTGIFMLDGVTETFTATYPGPSAAVASLKLGVASVGNGSGPLTAGCRLHAVAVWEGAALTAAQLTALDFIRSDQGSYVTTGGFYQNLSYIDLGDVYTSRITAYKSASGISSGDTMSHWATLATVEALDTADPSLWSVETQYLLSQGPTAKKSVIQRITDLSLLTGLKLSVDSSDLNSWPGSGQKWLDLSGGHYDFFLGIDATTAADPPFYQTPGTLLHGASYFYFTGTQYFTYDSANEAWMNAIHQDNAKASAVFTFYMSALGINYWLYGNHANDPAKIGSNFIVLTDGTLLFRTANGTGTFSYSRQSTQALKVVPGWHTAGFSIDEAAGTCVFMIDGVTESYTGAVYTTPSAAGATHTTQLGCAGASAGLATGFVTLASVSMWQGTALTATQLGQVGYSIFHNDDWVFPDPWTSFTITDVTARIILFGAKLTGAPDGSVSPAISSLGVTIDMPDRHLGFDITAAMGGSGTSTAGYTIPFDPPFKAVKAVALANYDLNTAQGEWYTLTWDTTHANIKFTQAGAVVSKTFSLHAYGYGAVVKGAP